MIELDIEDFRRIIQGRIRFRFCPDCNGEGILYYTEESDMPVTVEKFEAAGGVDNLENDTAGCEVCKGVGYVSNELSW